MGSGEVAIVALSTMISLKVTFSDGLGGDNSLGFLCSSNNRAFSSVHCLTSTCWSPLRLAMVLTTTWVLAFLVNSRRAIWPPFL